MSRQPYNGAARKLVIAFDNGTTYSGISYCLLDPGEIPTTVNVTKFPGQEHSPGSAKIPSIMLYDQKGQMRAAGAECNLPDNLMAREDENWHKVEWFKLRLKPDSIPPAVQNNELMMRSLPPHTTLISVFGDFLAYLLRCTMDFFKDTSPSKANQWDALIESAEFIISHPNGWEGSEQSKLRLATIKGKLIPDTPEGRDRVNFVTEGEASLHFCLFENFVDEGSQISDNGFLIADLGGGTLDFSSYKLIGTSPTQVQETAPALCELEGSLLVTMRATTYFEESLKATNSIYASSANVKHISERFDETTKRTFKDTSQSHMVQFGSIQDVDAAAGIRYGRLRIPGSKMADFFEPSIQAATDSILKQLQASNHPIFSVYLVGGFSANPYLVGELRRRLASKKITVSVPDGQTSKAVADGAISFYIDHFVTCRVAKLTYGSYASPPFSSQDPDHALRKASVLTEPSGRQVVPGGYKVILQKGIPVKEEEEFSQTFARETKDISKLRAFTTQVVVYVGPGNAPAWLDQARSHHFKEICTISADLSALAQHSQKNTGAQGQSYWKVKFDIRILFGLTEMRAQIVWDESGVQKRSNAQIIYDRVILDTGSENLEPELTDITNRTRAVNFDGFGPPGTSPHTRGSLRRVPKSVFRGH